MAEETKYQKHKREFNRNGIVIGKPQRGTCSISKSLFAKFVEQWRGK